MKYVDLPAAAHEHARCSGACGAASTERGSARSSSASATSCPTWRCAPPSSPASPARRRRTTPRTSAACGTAGSTAWASSPSAARRARPSHDLDDQVPPEVAEARRAELMEAQQAVHFAFNRDKVGRTLDVLVEEIDVVRGTAIGRTAWDAPDVDGRVHVAGGGRLQPGTIVPVRGHRRAGVRPRGEAPPCLTPSGRIRRGKGDGMGWANRITVMRGGADRRGPRAAARHRPRSQPRPPTGRPGSSSPSPR